MTKTAAAIFLGVLMLVVLSVWALYRALMFARKGSSLLLTQFVAIGIGFVGFAIALIVDYRRLNRWGWVLLVYVMAAGFLALVLVPSIAPPRNGAQRWLWGFQPSELAK